MMMAHCKLAASLFLFLRPSMLQSWTLRPTVMLSHKALRYRNENAADEGCCVAAAPPQPSIPKANTNSPSTTNSSSSMPHATSKNFTMTPSVYDVLEFRRRTRSQPGQRDDPYTLALCMEGGGIRGAVSAGMADALSDYGECVMDSFDCVYGSSAGALVGAYWTARQTECAQPVVTQVLPSQQFVCGKRLLGSIGRMVLDTVFGCGDDGTTIPATHSLPSAMNLSMVLDDVLMGGGGGDQATKYALDMDAFRRHDQKQPLRIVVSCADSNNNGTVVSRSFGSLDFGHTHRGHRSGLAACLEASMAVPAATGPLLPLLSTNGGSTVHTTAFDAFVAEPIPYVSAIEEGKATHVLCLCTRPHESPARTSGVYERLLAPLFFRRHNLPEVAETMRAGYAVDVYNAAIRVVHHEKFYKGAKIWGLAVPSTEPELSTTSLDQRQILRAFQAGQETVRQWLGAPNKQIDTTTYESPRMMTTMRNWTFASA